MTFTSLVHRVRKTTLVFREKRPLPNLLRISCCSSRVEKRILGLRPLVWKPSQGGGFVLGLSLGSTSMFRLTWNKSGYFSWMSQASRSYLTGECADEVEPEMEEGLSYQVLHFLTFCTYFANLTVVAFLGTKPVWNWIWNIFMEAI